MSREELEEKLRSLRAELFSIEAKLSVGVPPENISRRRQLKREIARVLTVMRERGMI
ncbi:MAG: 50S ribosomal protein L29 [Thermoproteota archaeon]|nr:MAG: 50S ribosomal protein L29 [Candidatus Korarchaeota archaeon]